jgi:hypothetical protein
MGEAGYMRIIIAALLLFLSSGNVWGKQYKIHHPLETDSLLVAWLIKNHVDKDAVFSIVPKSEKVDKNSSINTPNSPYRRSARFTAYDSAIRIFDIKDDCAGRIQPLVRILEMTPWRKHEYPEALRFEQDLVPLFPEKPGSGGLDKAFAFVDSYCSTSGSNTSESVLTDEIAFLALIGDDWKAVVYHDGMFDTVATEFEPHTFDYDFHNKQLIYVAADKSVRLLSAGVEKILLEADKHGFTQPAFLPDGKSIVIVKLIDGSSTNTDLIQLNPQTKKISSLVSQHSTLLDPFPLDSSHLYYANVTCVEGCGKIIQEIWHKNLTAGQAKQLTLLNAITHQPTVDVKRKWLYFSSNQHGHYHIWRLSLTTAEYERLTEGEVTDSHPRVSQSGSLYFIRTVKRAASLFKRDPEGLITPIALPKEYQKIRELRIRNDKE